MGDDFITFNSFIMVKQHGITLLFGVVFTWCGQVHFMILCPLGGYVLIISLYFISNPLLGSHHNVEYHIML